MEKTETIMQAQITEKAFNKLFNNSNIIEVIEREHTRTFYYYSLENDISGKRVEHYLIAEYTYHIFDINS